MRMASGRREGAGVSRREFARTVALGTAGLTALGTGTAANAVAGDEKPAGTDPPAKPRSEAEAGSEERSVEGPRAAEDLLLEIVRQRYPHENLTEDVLEAIRRDLRGVVARGELLRRYPLKNSDEPAFVFSAYRGPDAQRSE